MAIDVRSKQISGPAPLKTGAPALTPQALGARLWAAFKGAVSSFLAPVPTQAKGGLLTDVLRLLGGRTEAPTTFGQLAKPPAHVSPRAGMHFDEVVARAGKKPVPTWTDNQIVRARDTLREVSQGLPKERLEKDLFALPPGAVLHEDGVLAPMLKDTPTHVEVRKTPYLNTIDEIARFLESQVKGDGKTHAQEVNGSLVEVHPGGNAKAAVQQWEERRKGTAEERQADKLLGAVNREIEARQARTHEQSVATRRAAMAAQLKALPPGADVFAFQPDKLREQQPGVSVKDAPYLRTVEEAAEWLAKQATATGVVSAYRFNDDLLVADPKKGRGEALTRRVLEGWEQLG